jgi:hypothetical protein
MYKVADGLNIGPYNKGTRDEWKREEWNTILSSAEDEEKKRPTKEKSWIKKTFQRFAKLRIFFYALCFSDSISL